MRLLLDTHVLLWWLVGRALAPGAADAIGSTRSKVFVSPVSVWEAEIKAQRGKLKVDADLVQRIGQDGFDELPIRFEHGQVAGRLPAHHRDPFDRMLIAQAQLEGLRLVTRDPVFARYEVPLLAA